MISDLVQISPEDFQKPSAESIEDNINAKYANKVNYHPRFRTGAPDRILQGDPKHWTLHLCI